MPDQGSPHRLRPLRCLAVGAAVAAGLACAPTNGPLPSVSHTATFGVGGADNRGVSLAADDQTVVATWTATVASVTNVHAAVSRDGGASFGAPVRVNAVDGDARISGEQAPRVAIAGGNIIVAWQSRLDGQAVIRLTRSTDGGVSFPPATTIHQTGLDGTRGWASLALDAAGSAHVVWLDARTGAAPPEPAAAMPAGHVHGAHKSTRQNIFHAAIDARGTIQESSIAADVCFCCKTAVAVGSDGSVYAAWRHIYPPNLRDMAVARSKDDGRTFEAPVRVSEDGWAIDGCPEDGPSLAVDAAGIVHITWPTLLKGTTDRKGIFYSYSADGGKTFAPRAQVDEGAATARPAHPQLSVSGSRVVVTWDEGDGDVRHVKVRALTSKAAGAWTPELGQTVTVATGEVVTYPALAEGPGGTLVAWTKGPSETSALHVSRVRW